MVLTQLTPRAGMEHREMSVPPTQRCMSNQQNFPETFLWQRLLLEAVQTTATRVPALWVMVTGDERTAGDRTLTEVTSTLIWKYQGTRCLLSSRLSRKYNAIDYPDFRFNINL